MMASGAGSFPGKMPAPEVLSAAANADGLRDMQGLAARFFGGRSAAEPGVAGIEAA